MSVAQKAFQGIRTAWAETVRGARAGAGLARRDMEVELNGDGTSTKPRWS